MAIPVASILIVIFILWLQYEMKKSGKTSKKSLDLFWQKESESNLTRRKDITQLIYLTVSLDSLPMQDLEDDTLNSYRDTIRKYAARKMVNLSDHTNTELKFEYGVANYNHLSEYDNNYTAFVGMLQKWATRLYNKGYLPEAQAVLEFSIFSCLTDVTNAYRMLAKLYHNQKDSDKNDSLLEIIHQTKIKEKEKLIQELTSIINHIS
jgi:hypothetical protein